MNGDIKLGQLLCDEDIITKRQLNKALQNQVKGDKRALGEILVDLNYCSLDDITNAMMAQSDRAETKPQPKPQPKSNGKKKPIELSEDKILDTKFTLSVQTMVGAGMGLASLIGMWYTLQGEIEEAKQLPSLESLYQAEYPSRPEGYNWPRSYEQYKDQVGSLQEDMDDVYDTLEEYEEKIEELEKLVADLRVEVAKKRNK